MSGLKSVRKSRIARHIDVLPPSGIRRFFDLVGTMDDVISLGIGEPDFTTPWTIRESGIYSIERGHTSYTSNLGMLPLRRAICRHLEKNDRLVYDPETECLVTVGVSEALDLAVRAITEIGDEIIYTSPAFVSYPAEIAMAHGVPVPVETKWDDAFSPDPDAIEKAITPKTKAILINFPCNPTGATLSGAALKRLAKVAVDHDLLVLSDEIYSDLTYDEKHVSIASLPGMRERTIFLHGFSKAYAMTGWRIGYVCAPPDLISAMKKIHQYAIMSAPTVSQEAALEALRRGEASKEEMRLSYCERRDRFVAGLNDIGLDCLTPRGAFYAFPSIRKSGLTSEKFAEKLLTSEHVAVIPGSAFGPGGEGFVRCSYATGTGELDEALVRIARFMKKLRVK
ncbi:MAG: aminotransferase class I/II-fold pyridoxal phosphate-dependent enzyme [Victivallaceae bacterium]|nr:aminotransferase class I/II-fold pyridoxal phosphate-dependent enzyme [Victivallaceae bacterium]